MVPPAPLGETRVVNYKVVVYPYVSLQQHSFFPKPEHGHTGQEVSASVGKFILKAFQSSAFELIPWSIMAILPPSTTLTLVTLGFSSGKIWKLYHI